MDPERGFGDKNFDVSKGVSTPYDETLIKVDNSRIHYIVESGSNANGNYLRFSDGTQICYYSGTKTIGINNAYGSLFQGSYAYSFPKKFASTPAVAIGRTQWGTGASWGSVGYITTSSVTLRFVDAFSRTAASTDISYIAIGR